MLVVPFLSSVLNPDKAFDIGERGHLPLRKRRGEKTTICLMILQGVAMENGSVMNIEGDPEQSYQYN